MSLRSHKGTGGYFEGRGRWGGGGGVGRESEEVGVGAVVRHDELGEMGRVGRKDGVGG